jgi:uncharacterized protein with HEPN domain
MGKKIRDHFVYIDDILESINRILSYIDKMTFNEFKKDNKTIDAVVRNFEVIGEAANQLPSEFKKKHPLTSWREIVDFRNVIMHEYFGISLKIVWDIIETKLPELQKQIKEILADKPNQKLF